MDCAKPTNNTVEIERRKCHNLNIGQVRSAQLHLTKRFEKLLTTPNMPTFIKYAKEGRALRLHHRTIFVKETNS